MNGTVSSWPHRKRFRILNALPFFFFSLLDNTILEAFFWVFGLGVLGTFEHCHQLGVGWSEEVFRMNNDSQGWPAVYITGRLCSDDVGMTFERLVDAAGVPLPGGYSLFSTGPGGLERA